MAVGKKQRHGIRLPHNGMEGPIQDKITKEIVVPDTDLLIGTIFLIDRSLQHLDGGEGAGTETDGDQNERTHDEWPFGYSLK